MDNLLANVKSILTTTAEHWRQLAAAVPDELMTRKPVPGEWSAHEALKHLTDVERFVFPPRVEAFLAGQDLANYDPDAQEPPGDESPAMLAAEFARLRAKSLATLDRVSEADFARTVRHTVLGPVTLGQFLHEWAAHDLNHTMQAERALMQPYIAGCGPWRAFFKAHIMDDPRQD